ncbi:hypothetical protein [Companilactobacillus farciminis]|uniref:hypothetical protein n=1 Tax=Companilactobacillus farciminis TaxID=1612 RepID=UPI00241E9CFB|nr:hypothetical protein [Companilactobacillus farciminis]
MEEINKCEYCHLPYRVFENGDRLMPPNLVTDFWGIMPNYGENKVGTIMKTEKCPKCGRKLED